jgi:ABC-2 type transport system permease protein
MMLRLIAAKDLLEYLRDGRLYLAGGVVLVLLFTALGVGLERHQEVAAERAAAQGLDYDDWLAQPERHPHDAAHQGMHVFKPQSPLAILDPGIDPFVGSTIWLQAHRQSELKFRPAQDATGLQRFGELSPAWVLQVLGPLLVIVLGFNAFAGEREQGTLRQTLSLGVSPVRLLWGKVLALGSCLALLLVPAGIVIATAMGMTNDLSTSDTVARFAWLVLGYGLYLGIAAFGVLAVSALAPSSRVALVALLGVWIAGVTLVPRVASDFARLWHPSPSRLDFNAELDSDIGTNAARAWQAEFGVTTRWGTEVPLDQWGRALQLDDQTSYPVVDAHFNELWDTFDRQQGLQEWLGVAVPLLAIRAYSMGIAGTDFAHHREFSVAAERQRRAIQDIVSEDLVEHADARGAGHFDYRATAELWAKVPRFEYESPSALWALRENLRSLAVLAMTFAAAVALAHLAAARRARS